MELLFRPAVDLRGRWIELDIKVTDTVGRIKELVEEAEGIPVACQSVDYCAKELGDGHTLVDLEWVSILCRRHEKSDATKTTNNGDIPMVVEMETVKRRADVVVVTGGLEKNIKKRKKIKSKSWAEAVVTTMQAVRRRSFRVFLRGPERAAICRSSCDIDPFH